MLLFILPNVQRILTKSLKNVMAESCHPLHTNLFVYYLQRPIQRIKEKHACKLTKQELVMSGPDVTLCAKKITRPCHVMGWPGGTVVNKVLYPHQSMKRTTVWFEGNRIMLPLLIWRAYHRNLVIFISLKIVYKTAGMLLRNPCNYCLGRFSLLLKYKPFLTACSTEMMCGLIFSYIKIRNQDQETIDCYNEIADLTAFII